MSFREDMHTPLEPTEPALTIDEAIVLASHAGIERDQAYRDYDRACHVLYSRALTKEKAIKKYEKAFSNLVRAMKGA